MMDAAEEPIQLPCPHDNGMHALLGQQATTMLQTVLDVHSKLLPSWLASATHKQSSSLLHTESKDY
jgi:hypothetical protein